MFPLPVNTKVFLAPGVTDMRKSINALSILADQVMPENPFSGHLFVFCNRRKTTIKILYWDKNGFALWQKRLEKDRFSWPGTVDEAAEISWRELSWLLEGLNIREVTAHNPLNYTTIY